MVTNVNNEATNGSRFVGAYNLIDHTLRNQYNFRTNISFTDLIRRCSSLNTVIRVYEAELIDFARLRNAIIHSKSEALIAEPNIEVVEMLEKISRLISTPPLAIEAIKSGEVDIAYANITMSDLILEISRVRHSSIPIYKGETLIGVIRWRKFIEVLGGHIINNQKSVDEFIHNTTAEEFLMTYPSNSHYTIADSKITIEQALSFFNNNRKLACIIITKDGTPTCRPMGIITGGDIMDLMKVIEEFG
ncbi:MAG: hypothetical protein FWE16_00310 [Firmicutes bacterium]|nr:hypothetical protein [Bacillota bacterium]